MRSLSALITSVIALSSLGQTTVVVSTAPSNANQSFYSLQNGEVSAPMLSEWDLAFETNGITGSILVNTGKGVRVYKAPYTTAQWAALDTAGLAVGWKPQQNSETNWSSGALNQGLSSNPFDLGWGVYNVVTHNITGDSLFVLKLADGSWKKLRIDGYASSTDAFTFTWADLDGATEQIGSIVRANFAGKNFGYYSLASNSTVDHEPMAAEWDLLFTKYMGFVTQPVPSFYPVAGILQNRNVTALQVDGVPSSEAQWAGATFSSEMNIIGFDWKNFNMSTFMWEYAQDRTYFVKDRAGSVWKLVFTAYGGGANGNITFTQELMSATGVDDRSTSALAAVFPNPASNGTTTLVIDAAVPKLTMNIIDRSGKVVTSEQLNGLNGLSQHVIDTHGLVPGLYLIRVSGQGVDSSLRLVIE